MANHATIKGTKINAGDTVKVFYRIIEKEKTAGKTKREVKETTRERFQPFEGIVIGIRGANDNMSFIVRRIGVGNIGIERIFPAVSPWINKIVITKKGHARRAKLNFLRGAKKKNRLHSEAVAEEVVSKKELKQAAAQQTPNKS
ncbi:50S ribosomal protein L19 [Candidatus Gottesmanbacteria bacterium]|nr:50S ribosomal protein L19 [Candidatus Gottesmanbacteria bacterium]